MLWNVVCLLLLLIFLYFILDNFFFLLEWKCFKFIKIILFFNYDDEESKVFVNK